MSMHLTLLCGPVVPLPAPMELTGLLSGVTVKRSASSPSTCQLSFHTRKTLLGLDYEAVNHPQLLQFNRVIVVVTVDLVPWVLFDGFITNKELDVGAEEANLTVTCEDVRVKMDQVEVPYFYPFFLDIAKVYAILARYAVLGVVPVAIPPLTDDIEISTTEQQMTTDLKLIEKMAKAAGYIFYILPGPLPGTNVAYFGPKNRLFPPQPALTANLGPATNVESMNASHNPQAPQITYGTELVEKVPVPYTSLAYSRLPPFSLEPAILSLFAALGLLPEGFPAVLPVLPIKVKHCYKAGREVTDALGYAQGASDLATDPTVKLSGSLDSARYGWALMAPGIVGVRGMGIGFDGFYDVESVTHTIQLDRGSMSYKQSFELTREGMFGLTPVVPAPIPIGL